MSGPLWEGHSSHLQLPWTKHRYALQWELHFFSSTALTLVNKIVWFVVNDAKIKMWLCKKHFLHVGKYLLSKEKTLIRKKITSCWTETLLPAVLKFFFNFSALFQALYSVLVQLWSRLCSSRVLSRTDMELLEQVQQRATKVVRELEHLSHSERLRTGPVQPWQERDTERGTPQCL